jgi:hypothetical protein
VAYDATQPNQQTFSHLVHNPLNNQYLTIWTDYRHLETRGTDIYGQLVNG